MIDTKTIANDIINANCIGELYDWMIVHLFMYLLKTYTNIQNQYTFCTLAYEYR